MMIISRRNFLEKAAKAASLAALLLNTSVLDYTKAEEIKNELNSVRTGEITPKAYLEARANLIPEIVEARKTEKLAGLLYEPSEEELGRLAANLLSSRIGNSELLKTTIQNSLDSVVEAEKERNGLATCFPTATNMFGQKCPIYIVFNRNLFNSPNVKNDADVDSTFKHELVHVKDYYEGIGWDTMPKNIAIASNGRFKFPINSVSRKFFESISELRAHYLEIEEALREKALTKRFSISQEYFTSTLG